MSGSFSESGTNGFCGDGGEIMLFGVRVKVDPMRKSVSMNNLSQYEQTQESSNVASDVAAGYASADEAAPNQSSGNREHKRGIPWTEDEHKLFLLGLQQVGKGDWRGISRNFVKTRTPTQVASHAQKYFLRKNNLNRRRRRSSLFDITTESVTPTPVKERRFDEEDKTPPPLLPPPTELPPNIGASEVLSFPINICPVLVPVQIENPMEKLSLLKGDNANHESLMIIRPIPILPIAYETSVDRNLNQKPMVDPSPLSLKLSLSMMSRISAFQVVPRFNNADSVISVA